MNKYVLIPREQYDKFKEFLLSEQTQNNHNEDNMPQESSLSQKETFQKVNDKDNQMTDDQMYDDIRSESEQLDLKQEKREKIPPPPGVPAAETLSSSSIHSNNKIRGKKKQEGYGERPEWFKYWNKNIR